MIRAIRNWWVRWSHRKDYPHCELDPVMLTWIKNHAAGEPATVCSRCFYRAELPYENEENAPSEQKIKD